MPLPFLSYKRLSPLSCPERPGSFGAKTAFVIVADHSCSGRENSRPDSFLVVDRDKTIQFPQGSFFWQEGLSVDDPQHPGDTAIDTPDNQIVEIRMDGI